ncbi:hypothetical protein ACFQ60_43005 [Streptomyces zhihengii]
MAAAHRSGLLRALNVYGPTECTVDATAGWIDEPGEPHIGAVLPGLRMRLLDENLAPAGPGRAASSTSPARAWAAATGAAPR